MRGWRQGEQGEGRRDGQMEGSTERKEERDDADGSAMYILSAGFYGAMYMYGTLRIVPLAHYGYVLDNCMAHLCAESMQLQGRSVSIAFANVEPRNMDMDQWIERGGGREGYFGD